MPQWLFPSTSRLWFRLWHLWDDRFEDVHWLFPHFLVIITWTIFFRSMHSRPFISERKPDVKFLSTDSQHMVIVSRLYYIYFKTPISSTMSPDQALGIIKKTLGSTTCTQTQTGKATSGGHRWVIRSSSPVATAVGRWRTARTKFSQAHSPIQRRSHFYVDRMCCWWLHGRATRSQFFSNTRWGLSHSRPFGPGVSSRDTIRAVVFLWPSLRRGSSTWSQSQVRSHGDGWLDADARRCEPVHFGILHCS